MLKKVEKFYCKIPIFINKGSVKRLTVSWCIIYANFYNITCHASFECYTKLIIYAISSTINCKTWYFIICIKPKGKSYSI